MEKSSGEKEGKRSGALEEGPDLSQVSKGMKTQAAEDSKTKTMSLLAQRSLSHSSSCDSGSGPLPTEERTITMQDIVRDPSQLPLCADVIGCIYDDITEDDLIRPSLVCPGTRLTLLYPKMERAATLRNQKDGTEFTELASFDHCTFGVLPKDPCFDNALYLCPRHLLRAERKPQVVRCLREMRYTVAEKEYEIQRNQLFRVSNRQTIINSVEYVVWMWSKSGTMTTGADMKWKDEEEVLVPLHVHGFFTPILDPKLYHLSDLLDEVNMGTMHLPIRIQAVSPGDHVPMDKYTLLEEVECPTIVAVTNHGEALRITTDVPLVFQRLNDVVSTADDEAHAGLSLSLRVLGSIQFLQSAFATVTTATKGTLSEKFPQPYVGDGESEDEAEEDDLPGSRRSSREESRPVPDIEPPPLPEELQDDFRTRRRGTLTRQPPVHATQRKPPRLQRNEDEDTEEDTLAASPRRRRLSRSRGCGAQSSPKRMPGLLSHRTASLPVDLEIDERQSDNESPFMLPARSQAQNTPPSLVTEEAQPSAISVQPTASLPSSPSSRPLPRTPDSPSGRGLASQITAGRFLSPSPRPFPLHDPRRNMSLPEIEIDSLPHQRGRLRSAPAAELADDLAKAHNLLSPLARTPQGRGSSDFPSGDRTPELRSDSSPGPSSARPAGTLDAIEELISEQAPRMWNTDVYEPMHNPFPPSPSGLPRRQPSHRGGMSSNEAYLVRQVEQLRHFNKFLEREKNELTLRMQVARSVLDEGLYARTTH